MKNGSQWTSNYNLSSKEINGPSPPTSIIPKTKKSNCTAVEGVMELQNSKLNHMHLTVCPWCFQPIPKAPKKKLFFLLAMMQKKLKLKTSMNGFPFESPAKQWRQSGLGG